MSICGFNYFKLQIEREFVNRVMVKWLIYLAGGFEEVIFLFNFFMYAGHIMLIYKNKRLFYLSKLFRTATRGVGGGVGGMKGN